MTTPPRLAGAGAAGIAVAIAVFAALHVVPPSSEVDPTRRTISQYALLPNGWAFDLAVIALAVGSLAVLAALVRARLVPLGSGAALGLMLWSVSLVAVVYFQKHNWAVGPSVDGDIHRVASAVAFLSLPVAALLAVRRRPGGHARAVAVGAVVSLLCITPVLWAILSEPYTGVRWWQAIPLGGVERVLALCEVLTVLLMARWAARSDATRPAATAVASST
jgi:hypothetical protein